MIIYKAEANIDGLADRILANQSVAYDSKIQVWTPSEREFLQRQSLTESLRTAAKLRAMGSIEDKDLFFTKSILVSTNWNKNDDVFSQVPVWAARHTPSHKPTNLEHDQNQLVGHITDTWAIDADGNIIPEDTLVDDLPELYHLANGIVKVGSKKISNVSDIHVYTEEGGYFMLDIITRTEVDGLRQTTYLNASAKDDALRYVVCV